MIMSKRFSNSSNTHDELEIILNHLIAFIDNEKILPGYSLMVILNYIMYQIISIRNLKNS